MNNLPNELLCEILNFLDLNDLVKSYKVTKVLFRLRKIVPVQVCKVYEYSGENYPYYINNVVFASFLIKN